MKRRDLLLMSAALVVALNLLPATTWATRALGVTLTGEITASPSSTQIEIGHTVYRIQANSPAAASARSFFLGQFVDVTLNRPAINAKPEVVSIAAHSG